MAVSASAEKSAAFDETAHLTAGTSYLYFQDYRLHPENGWLPQIWAALPFKFSRPRFPPLDQEAWRRSNVWKLGDRFLYHQGNAPEQMLFQSRAMIALLGAATGLLVYLWSRTLFGRAGGFVSLIFFIFSPAMLAHGALVTSDMAGTLFMLAAAWSFHRLLEKLSFQRLLICGLSFGLLAVSKFSCVIMAPVILLMAGARWLEGGPVRTAFAGKARSIQPPLERAAWLAGAAAACCLIAWAVIWTCYNFRYSICHPRTPALVSPLVSWDCLLDSDRAVIALAGWMRSLRLLPEAFLYGLCYVARFSENRLAFFMGEKALEGWRTFFPAAFLLKTTLPFLFVLALIGLHAFRTALRDREVLRENWRRFSPFILFLAVYWLFAIFSRINIGHRHILPVYPFLFILAGALGRGAARKTKPAVIATGLLAAWHAGESAFRRPHYLSYFNELIGGPKNAFHYFVDSSLDWGQDLPALRRWLGEQAASTQGRKPVHLAYFGTASPRRHGIHSRRLARYFDWRAAVRPDPLSEGWYCVSATYYQGLYLGPYSLEKWSPEREKEFQYCRRLALGIPGNGGSSPGISGGGRDKILRRWEQIRFFKLIQYLRAKEPVARAAYSILIFSLDSGEVRRLLHQPIEDCLAAIPET